MDTNTFFEPLLGLHPPFHISKITRDPDEGQYGAIHIYVTIEDTYRPVNTDGSKASIHDYESRKWRHLNLFEYLCYVHCEVPKYKYKDGSVKTMTVPWARAGSGFTLLMEGFAIELIKLYGVVAAVARQLGISDQRLWTLIGHYSQKSDSSPKDLSRVRRISFDETSRKKGHDYVSIFLDSEKGELLWVEEGKSADSVKKFVEAVEQRGLKKEEISDVSIDLSPAFQAGVREQFQNAAVTFDKFHICQLMMRAFDHCRKSLSRKTGIKVNKWLFLKDYHELSIEEEDQLEDLLSRHSKLELLYTLKHQFFYLWKQYKQPEAASFLCFWIQQIKDLKMKATTTLAKTFEKCFEGVIQFFESGLSNGILEGFNSKVQTMKRNARGYRHTENFITMIWWHCAKNQ